MLQRLPQLAEQPRVFNGDDGLRGKILHQFDLLFGEWTNLLAIDREGADHLILLEHRDHKERANAKNLDGRHGHWITPDVGRLSRKIDHMGRLLRSGHPHDRSIVTWRERLSKELHKLFRHTERSHRAHAALLDPE